MNDEQLNKFEAWVEDNEAELREVYCDENDDFYGYAMEAYHQRGE